MSEQKNSLAAILEQYERNNKSKSDTKSDTKFSLKNYFAINLPKDVKSGTKKIRFLPSSNGGSPFAEIYVHKTQIEGEWKTFVCLKHQKKEACPFCEAKDLLYATGDSKDKELAKKYQPRLVYIAKLIDRSAEEDGVKFYRFSHDYRKTGVYDKIIAVLDAINMDIFDPINGCDLSFSINRDQNNNSVVSGIVPLPVSKLSNDDELMNKWLSDDRTWEDVYSIKSYEYLEIIVKGGIPVWDNDAKVYVDKDKLNQKHESTSESELTMGLDQLKNDTQVIENSDDDLPF